MISMKEKYAHQVKMALLNFPVNALTDCVSEINNLLQKIVFNYLG